MHLIKTRIRKIVQSLTICTTSMIIVLVIDIVLAKTNYSLTGLYKIGSAVMCLRARAPSCHTNSKSIAPPVGMTTGIVVSEQREATQVGINILNAGGNAIDAAVGVGYALAVTYPSCGNLGGGGFMLVRFADGRSRFLDFRETAPAAATPNMYLDSKGQVIPHLSTKGYLAVGVPGTVKGLDYALATYGTRSRQQVMAAAITLAKQGFILQVADAALLKQHRKTFETQSNIASIFLKNGQSYQTGDRFVQSNLAKSLHSISQQGTDAFYRGAIASSLVQASDRQGGILTKADLAQYKIRDTEPLKCNYRNYQILTAAPGRRWCDVVSNAEYFRRLSPISEHGANAAPST